MKNYKEPDISKDEKSLAQKGVENFKTDWPAELGPKKLTHRHMFVAHLAALGLSNAEICRRTGMTAAWMSIITRTQLMKDEIKRVREDLFAGSTEQRFKLMLPNAMQAIETALKPNNGTKQSLQVDTAFKLCDRAFGKPQQKIEHTGSAIKDLFELMDDLRSKSKTIEAKAQPIEDAQVIEPAPAPVADPRPNAYQEGESDLKDDDINSFLERTTGDE